MVAAALYNALTARRLSIRAAGAVLHVGPPSSLTAADRKAIQQAKAELLSYVSAPMPRPYLADDGDLIIPFSTHPIYQHWAGGQSVWATLLELDAPLSTVQRYAYHDPGLLGESHADRCKGTPCEGADYYLCVECGYYVEKVPAQARGRIEGEVANDLGF